jgi:hypothetical protein
MRAYSVDLRKKIGDVFLGGRMAKEEAACTFGVGMASLRSSATSTKPNEESH